MLVTQTQTRDTRHPLYSTELARTRVAVTSVATLGKRSGVTGTVLGSGAGAGAADGGAAGSATAAGSAADDTGTTCASTIFRRRTAGRLYTVSSVTTQPRTEALTHTGRQPHNARRHDAHTLTHATHTLVTHQRPPTALRQRGPRPQAPRLRLMAAPAPCPRAETPACVTPCPAITPHTQTHHHKANTGHSQPHSRNRPPRGRWCASHAAVSHRGARSRSAHRPQQDHTEPTLRCDGPGRLQPTPQLRRAGLPRPRDHKAGNLAARKRYPKTHSHSSTQTNTTPPHATAALYTTKPPERHSL